MFDLTNKVIVITGGAGLLGREHALAVAQQGATPVLLDVNDARLGSAKAEIESETGTRVDIYNVDISDETKLRLCCESIVNSRGRIDALINNAANNPKMEDGNNEKQFSRLENFSIENWNDDIRVGLTGAFLCARYFGTEISRNPNGGTIINISSDLGLVGPDQRLYRKDGIDEDAQPVKPVTYSVIKAGLIGLTRYLATYWPQQNVRCNALCPGGIFNGQADDFVEDLIDRIPMHRMATIRDYRSAIVFMLADESAYMNGAVLAVDGGRTAW